MRKKCVQISLFDICTDVLESMENNQPEPVKLINEYIDFEAIISPRFRLAYYNRYERKRINSLESFIHMLFLKNILNFIFLLKYNLSRDCKIIQ